MIPAEVMTEMNMIRIYPIQNCEKPSVQQALRDKSMQKRGGRD